MPLHKPTDGYNWRDAERSILAALDITAEYAELGIADIRQPNTDGWAENSANKSQSINIGDNPALRGRFTDLGSDNLHCSLWEYAVHAGRFATWQEARAYYATKAGVELPGRRANGRKTKGGRATTNRAATAAESNGRHPQRFASLTGATRALSAKLQALPQSTTWLYHDASGREVAAVLRFDRADGSKEYRPLHLVRPSPPPALSLWQLGDPPGGWPLYNLLSILVSGETTTTAAPPVYICEGEKAADAAAAIGLVATTSAHGARSPKKTDWSPLSGREVILLPDADRAGEQYMVDVSSILTQLDPPPSDIRVLRLPNLPAGGDVADWIDQQRAGGGDAETIAASFMHLAAAAVPYTPPAAAFRFANADITAGEAGPTVTPIDINVMVERFFAATDNWPRRVGESIFIHSPARGLYWLDEDSKFFGWASSILGNAQWSSSRGCMTQKQFFREIGSLAHQYQAVESLPHWPPLPHHYYTHPPIEPASGTETLDNLLARFCPASDLDADLLKALFVTPFWGGPPGARPCFALISDQGRGVGKTKAVTMLAMLAGGYFGMSLGEKIEDIKKRLLTKEARSKRLAMIDNVKTQRLSWAELESLITAPEISGHAMYEGERTRPNTLTWVLTLNGPAMSKDMAQRSVIIKLDRPEHNPNWEEDTAAYIDTNRAALLADIASFFSEATSPLLRSTRWASWEKAVLARLPEPDEAQALIIARQDEVNADDEEAEDVEDYFRLKLESFGYDVETENIHIPNDVAAAWFAAAVGARNSSPTAMTRMVKQAAGEGIMKCLRPNLSRKHGRGLLWRSNNGEVLYDIETRAKYSPDRKSDRWWE